VLWGPGQLLSTVVLALPQVKIRPASGLEAVDYLMPGYWVFGRLVEALAAIGYDHNNLVGGGRG
jgi:hypothetical protein